MFSYDQLSQMATLRSASLIVTTYNWPEALSATLRSALRQSVPPAEVIVADDGSGPETARIVEATLRRSAVRWCHVRHEDQGIRQARIKNLAVKYSRFPYLIFIDHDVILHSDFVSDHLRMAERGVFLQGKRCFVSPSQTTRLLHDDLFLPFFLGRRMKNRKNAVRNLFLAKHLSRKKNFQSTLRGCNLSMERKDFLQVDGYDETFDRLWGREDSDICYRLFHNGVRVKNLWFCAVQYHLHHTVVKSSGRDRLDDELERVLSEKRQKGVAGYSRIGNDGGIVSASNGF
jgi:glycosyltransferase involved in cell wall biosynthesis